MSNRPHHRRRRPRRPTAIELDLAARWSSALLGCTCTEVDIKGNHHLLSIAHDDDCPASTAGRVHVSFPRGHRP